MIKIVSNSGAAKNVMVSRGPIIIVLVKQVPEMDKVKFDTEKGKIDRSSAKGEVNPLDLNALEAAIQMKEKLGGTVTAISMGPPQAESALRDVLARGLDRAILLTDRRFGGADTLATSYTLASAIRKIGKFDFIICGEKTVDGDTGQVGPEVAEHLGIPHVAYVSEIKDYGKEKLTVVSQIGENNYLLEIKSPGLITVTKDVNKPRYLSLSKKLKAEKLKIDIWDFNDLANIADVEKVGIKGSPTQVHKITIPSEKGRRGKIFREAPEETVKKLVDEIEEII